MARERALELLYESAIKERDVATIVSNLAAPPDPYTVTLLNAAEGSRAVAHELISANAIDWPLERIALIDRLVMELAIGELLLPDGPPRAVVLDEAVEIARTYSGDNAPYFVNGVLSSVADELGR
jgi:N utilization substance protein B